MAFTPPKHLSPSSINTFLQCPLKFKFSKIDGLVEPPTEATLMGNFVHSVLEDLYALEPAERTLQAAKQLMRKQWDEVYGEQVAEIVSPNKLNQFRWNSWFCVENLWKMEDPPSVHLDGIEFELNNSLQGVQMKGFIDRFNFDEDGDIVVSDYKTGKVPRKEWENDKFFQLYIYAALLREAGVGEVKKLQLMYLKAAKMLEKTVEQNELESAIETVVNVRRSIEKACETESFDYNKSILCNWCYFKPQCPGWKN
jgi:putative RecB family exonuclease